MLRNALRKAVTELEKARERELIFNYVLIGGFAVSAWGYSRATEDVDFAISLDRRKLEELANFLKGELRRGEVGEPLIATITFERESYPIQLIVFPNTWEKVAFSDVQEIKLGTEEIRCLNWRSTVLLKLYAGSPADLEDAKRIIATQEPGERGLETLRRDSVRLRVSKKLDRALKSGRKH